MSLPNFTEDGVLPIGIHSATLEEIEKYFCSYGDIEKRKMLFNSFCKYVNQVKMHNVKFYICIDGSYVTSKECPGDLDVLILYDFEYYNNEWGELISDKVAPLMFKGLQILSGFMESFGEESLLDFAQQIKNNPTLRKGIVKVIL